MSEDSEIKSVTKVAWAAGCLGRLARAPLTRNGYALAASAGCSSLLGFAFWVLAARLFTRVEIGGGVALISMMFTLGGLAQLNLGNILNRYLPVAGGKSRQLILACYLITAVAAFSLSLGFVLLAAHFAQALSFLSGNAGTALMFVTATMAWAFFSLQDSVLSGLRRSIWVPLENALYGAVKIGLLLPFGLTLLGSQVFAAWALPLLPIIAIVNYLVFTRFLPPSGAPASGDLSKAALKRFFGWDYLGTTAAHCSYGASKLIILNFAGSSDLAAFHLAWAVSYSAYLLSNAMNVSLVSEGAIDRENIRALAADSVIHTFGILFLACAALVLAAPLIMAMFGAEYAADSSWLLRILVVSSLPGAVIGLFVAIARLHNDMVVVAAVQCAGFFLIIALGVPLVAMWGAAGMAATWAVSNSIVAAGIAILVYKRNGRQHLRQWLYSLSHAWKRQIAPGDVKP